MNEIEMRHKTIQKLLIIGIICSLLAIGVQIGKLTP